MITANIAGLVRLALDSPYDVPGRIELTGEGPVGAGAVEAFADWLSVAVGFQGHTVGYPVASPRDLHAALLGPDAARWRISDLVVTDAAPLAPLPDGAVS